MTNTLKVCSAGLLCALVVAVSAASPSQAQLQRSRLDARVRRLRRDQLRTILEMELRDRFRGRIVRLSWEPTPCQCGFSPESGIKAASLRIDANGLTGADVNRIVDDIEPCVVKAGINSFVLYNSGVWQWYVVKDPTGAGTQLLSKGGLTSGAWLEGPRGQRTAHNANCDYKGYDDLLEAIAKYDALKEVR